MSSIDERVVAMKFDNADFEKKLSATIDSLEELRNALKFPDSKKGIQDLKAETDKFSMSNMANNVDHVANRLSVMGAIGFTVIQDLTRSLISFSKKTLTGILDPVFSGGRDRALKIEQAKFQFRGLGQDVEKSMASALEAVKGTAYGLDAAAAVASQFGAAGMKAGDEMTGALRGVAGMAAMTGTSYEEIGSIFTRIAGEGKLSSVRLQQFATRGVNAAAKLADQMGVTEAEVRKMVTEGKISFQEFATAMDDAFGEHATKANETYTGSVANMRAALSRIGASIQTPKLEAQRRIFNQLTVVIDEVAEALAPVVDMFGKLALESADNLVEAMKGLDFKGLRQFMLPISLALKNTVEALRGLAKTVHSAFRDIFPAPTATQFYKIAMAIRSLSERLKAGDETAENLKRTFRGLFAILGIAWELFKGVATVVASLFGVVMDGSGGILEFTGSLGDMLVALHAAIRDGNALTAFFAGLGKVLSVPIRLVQSLASGLGALFAGITGADFGSLDGSVDGLDASIAPLAQFGKNLATVFSGIVTALTPLVRAILDVIGDFVDKIGDAFRKGGFEGVLDVLNTVLLGGILLTLRKFFNGMDGLFTGAGITELVQGGFQQIFGGLTEHLSIMQTNLKAGTLMKIAAALGILAISVIMLSTIDPAKLTTALTAMSVMFAQMFLALNIFSKGMMGLNTLQLPVIAASLGILAGAMLLLSASIVVLSKLDWSELAKGLAGVAGGMAVMAFGVKALSSSSVRVLPAAAAMILLATGLRIMASAVKAFAEIDYGSMARGLVAMSGVLALVAAFNAVSGKSKGMLVTAANLLALSVSLNVIARALGKFGGMKWGEIGRGLTAMGGALAIIAAGVALIPASIVWIGPSLIAVSIAVAILGKAIASMGGMSVKQIAKGLGTLGGSLAILAAGLTLMSGSLAGSAALVAASIGLSMLVPSLVILGSLSIGTIATALGTLAGIFVVLGVAGALLTPVVPTLFGLAAALALFGVAVLAVGAGVLLFSMGLAGLAAGLAGIALAFKTFIIQIAQIVPELLSVLGDMIVGILEIVITSAPLFGEAFDALMMAMLDAIDTVAPRIIQTLAKLLVTLVQNIAKAVPKFVSAGMSMIVGILRGIANTIGEVVKEGARVVVNFINGVADNLGDVIDAGIKLIISFINGVANGIRNNTSDLIDAGENLGDAIISGMVQGLWSGDGVVARTARSVALGALAGARSALGIFSPSREFAKIGAFTVAGFVVGMERDARLVERSAENLGKTALTPVKNAMANVETYLDSNADMSPKIRPILDLSDLEQKKGRISSLLDAPKLDISSGYENATLVAAQEKLNKVLQDQIEVDDRREAPVSQVKYIQNNYSPESLSEVEIYRQTKNQISTLKEALSNDA